MFISPAFAQSAAPAGGAGDFFIQLVPLFLIIAIMYFLVLRPQQQRVKAHQQMVSAVKRGDVVVTGGGIIGKVVKVLENDEVMVEIADEVRIRVVKTTIADVRSKSEPVASDAKSKNGDEDKK
ncbi:MAG: preprotein translocase subunit YajC [Alphaproteobacteria bacterium]|nr:preprotein translocase subunit YajC [Alphaproteobacteria bacterium]